MVAKELLRIARSLLNEHQRSATVISVDTSFVKPLLKRIRSRLIGAGLGNLEAEKILNGAFSKYRIWFEYGSGNPSNGNLAQTGLIDAFTNENGTIGIHYDEHLWETFENDDLWTIFANSVEELISHELVHREQFKRINPEVLKRLEIRKDDLGRYLSNKQEAMAFAKEAVEELVNQGYSADQILQLASHPFHSEAPSRNESDKFWLYTETFDSGSRELRAFLKYIQGYATQLKSNP